MGGSRDAGRLPAPACRPDERDCIQADPAPHPPTRQAVALMDMTEQQWATYHAAMDLRDFAQGRAHAARVAIEKADSQQGKDYLTAKAEWWDQRAKVAEEIIRQYERNP
jgi:hypothetical protein